MHAGCREQHCWESQPEWVFLKHHWELHTELGWLARAHSRLSCSPPLSRVGFSRSSPPAIPSMTSVCILLILCRSGHRGVGSGTDQREGPGHCNVPCAPKLWLPTYTPQTRPYPLTLPNYLEASCQSYSLTTLSPHETADKV